MSDQVKLFTDDGGVQRGVLFVDFGGSLYRYEDVTLDEVSGVLAADASERSSVGRTLNETIKRRRMCARVEITEQEASDG